MTDERLRVPPAYAALCEFCGGTVDVRHRGAYRYTHAWIRGDGTVALPNRRPKWAHGQCVENAAHARVSLFGDEVVS